MIRRLPVALAAAALACACAGERAVAPAPPAGSEPSVLRAAELARVRCVLVAPFENGSDSPGAGEAATSALVSGVEAGRARVYPVRELRAAFQGTPLELPAGFGPSLARELAGIVGTDAALSGAVEGRSRDSTPELLVTMRLTITGDNELVFAQTVLVRPGIADDVDATVRREVLAAARPMLEKLGDGSERGCYDAGRVRTLRKLALAQAKPEPPRAATPTPTPPAPARAPRTPRQEEWAKRLGAGERLLVEDVVFAGRTAELQRDAGLADLAVAFVAQRDGALRLEGFVDSTGDRAGDDRLSVAMAQAAAQRLVALGVPRGRIAWAGRGGTDPILPNFTARGRAANRRVEAVLLR